MVNCPECDTVMEVKEGTMKGEILECNDCGAELEVTSTEPVALQLAPQEEEDWGE